MEQLVAHLAHNQEVRGSSPLPVTLNICNMTAIIAKTLSSLMEDINNLKLTKEDIVQIFTRTNNDNSTEYICIYITTKI